MGVSGPSLLIESTDSMIIIYIWKLNYSPCSVGFTVYNVTYSYICISAMIVVHTVLL